MKDINRSIEGNPASGFSQANPQELADSKRVQRAADALGANRRASLRSRAGLWQPSDEPMACPTCDERYDFGDLCPTCGTDLVGVSVVHLFKPGPTAWSRLVGGLRNLFIEQSQDDSRV